MASDTDGEPEPWRLVYQCSWDKEPCETPNMCQSGGCRRRELVESGAQGDDRDYTMGTPGGQVGVVTKAGADTDE